MFSGIVEGIAYVQAIQKETEGRRIVLRFPFTHSEVLVGDSIAIDGVCLTAVTVSDDGIVFDVSSETLRCTTLGSCKVDDRLHFERSLRVGDRVHGHFVTGHVDGIAQVADVSFEGDTQCLTIDIPEGLSSFIVPKGAIAVKGVSLTVGPVSKERFGVFIVPHTRAVTLFGAVRKGDQVNLEIDMIARYVRSQLQAISR